jgi:hypothetical protein
MKLSGSYNLNVKKEVVWKALNEASILKQCVPGCESFEKEGENAFYATATNQIGPMNASFSGKINLSNIKTNESYTLSGEGQSSVGFVNGEANVKLSEANNTTTLTYEVNINIGGKIAQLGSRLINGVAKKMSDYFFGRFADIVSSLKENESSQEIKEVRVKELKSNFLNVYIYLSLIVFILVIVAILYFVFR